MGGDKTNIRVLQAILSPAQSSQVGRPNSQDCLLLLMKKAHVLKLKASTNCIPYSNQDGRSFKTGEIIVQSGLCHSGFPRGLFVVDVRSTMSKNKCAARLVPSMSSDWGPHSLVLHNGRLYPTLTKICALIWWLSALQQDYLHDFISKAL